MTLPRVRDKARRVGGGGSQDRTRFEELEAESVVVAHPRCPQDPSTTIFSSENCPSLKVVVVSEKDFYGTATGTLASDGGTATTDVQISQQVRKICAKRIRE